MKRRLTLLLLLVLLDAGCRTVTQQPIQGLPVAALTETLLIPKISETANPVPTPSKTIKPKTEIDQSIVPTTAMHTEIPFYSVTLSPKSNLSNEAKESYILELQKTNNGCQLPCWWGLTPGKTTWKEAEQLAQNLAATVMSKPLEDTSGDIFHWFNVDFKGEPLYDSLAFVESQWKIDAVLVQGHPKYNPIGFESLWRKYSPGQLLKTYGVPSRVLLRAPGQTGIGTTGKTGYILWLFYDLQGFMLRYDGGVADLPIYHICPDSKEQGIQIDRIDITAQTLHSSRPLEWSDGILVREMNEDSVKTIQEAAGMSVEEFHGLFLQNDKPPCFDTPHNIWPVR